jgi:hypothetical protein
VYDDYKQTSQGKCPRGEQTGSETFFVAFRKQIPAQTAVPAPSAEAPPAAEQTPKTEPPTRWHKQCGLVRWRCHRLDLVLAGAPALDGL